MSTRTMGPQDKGAPCAIRRAATGASVAARAPVARSWRQRAVGLLGRRGLPAGEGLIFPRCRAIHTVGMQFPIDTVFVSREWVVVALQEAVPPGRLLGPVWRAWGVIELPAGVIRQAQLKLNDQLEVVPVENADAP